MLESQRLVVAVPSAIVSQKPRRRLASGFIYASSTIFAGAADCSRHAHFSHACASGEAFCSRSQAIRNETLRATAAEAKKAAALDS